MTKHPIILIIAACIVLVGCPAKALLLKSRSLHSIDAGYDTDKRTEKLLDNDDAVDEVAEKVINAMNAEGFILRYRNTSFGLQPFTGHTQNLDFNLPGNFRVRLLVVISKKEFSATFEEIESEPKSNHFETSENDLKIVERAMESITQLTLKIYSGRIVRTSKYHVSIGPNQTN